MLCKKCGKEYPEGANICPSCNISLEQCDKEKQKNQGVFPVLKTRKGGWAAATLYGIPVVVPNVVGKDNKDSAAVRAAGVASVLAGAIAYGIPAPNTRIAVGAAVATAGALGANTISSRIFEDRDYERVKDTKLCNHCNAKIKLDDKVCPQCGKKLGFAALGEAEKEYK